MRIIIDMQGAQTPINQGRGIERYVMSFVCTFLKHWQEEHEVILLCNAAFPASIVSIRSRLEKLFSTYTLKVFFPLVNRSDIDEKSHDCLDRSQQLRLNVLHAYRPDWVILTGVFEGYEDGAVVQLQKGDICWKQACLVYDLIPWANIGNYLNDPRKKKWYEEKLNTLRYADIVFTISEFSRLEILKYTCCKDENVINISSGIDQDFLTEPDLSSVDNKKLIRKYQLNRPYILYVGGYSERKNIQRLIKAFASLPWRLRRRYQLLLVGKMTEEQRGLFLSLLGEYRWYRNISVKFIGAVTDAQLAVFYRCCKLFVYPSLYEGFGLPPLEAMASGVASIASSATSLPEVITNKDALFDPYSAKYIKNKMTEVLSNKDLFYKLIKSGKDDIKRFSWCKTVMLACKAIESSFLILPSILPSSEKPILAYVSPLPPLRTGIASYSFDIIPEMMEFYELVLVVDQDDVLLDDSAGLKIKSKGWLLQHYDEVDRVLYHVGNSIAHDYILSLIELCPGIIVLHDFYLSGLFYDKDYRAGGGVFLPALYENYGYSALLYDQVESRAASVQKFSMNMEFLRKAVGIIVHSKHATNLLSTEYKNTALLFKTYESPLAIALPVKKCRSKQEAKKYLGFSEDVMLICSFGFVDRTKASLRLVKFWCETDLPGDPILVLVGGFPENEYGEEIQNMAKNNPKVRLVGYSKEDEYKLYLESADIAIQLRHFSRGESSKTVLDAMAYGLPVIINAHGALAEIDGNSVYMLPNEWSFAELEKALHVLLIDQSYREILSNNAKNYCMARTPKVVAKKYMQIIEKSYRCDEYNFIKKNLLNASEAAVDMVLDKANLLDLITNIQLNELRKGKPRLLLDITDTYRRSDKTGIGRSVKGIIQNIQISDDYLFEAIYEREGIYYLAHNWVSELLNIPCINIDDKPLCWQDDDIVIGLDLNIDGILHNYEFLYILKLKGIRFYFLVYDLLPLQLPQYFPSFLEEQFSTWLTMISSLASGFFTGSQATAKALNLWLVERKNNTLPCVPIRLGADFMSTSHDAPELSEVDRDIIAQLQANNALIFIMVGTIEPRKGHKQVLAAFNRLWRKGYNVSLVIIGKTGWMMNDFLDEIYQYPHSELNHRLFILPLVSDALLQYLYGISASLIAASEGEGLGLPLLEATSNGLPVIARDLPVFREAIGNDAIYFNGLCGKAVYVAVVDFIRLSKEGEKLVVKHVLPSWKECSQDILEALQLNRADDN